MNKARKELGILKERREGQCGLSSVGKGQVAEEEAEEDTHGLTGCNHQLITLSKGKPLKGLRQLTVLSEFCGLQLEGGFRTGQE